MKVLIILFTIFTSDIAFAELLKPNPALMPIEVISIQLNALKDNNNPYLNAGVVQTWEFAHPSNRKYTGPLENFVKMMSSPSYVIMLDHTNHNIISVSDRDFITYFFVEIIDKEGNKFGFTWTLEKVITESKFKDCWMTTAVSQPLPLAKSA
mgnify:FL=1